MLFKMFIVPPILVQLRKDVFIGVLGYLKIIKIGCFTFEKLEGSLVAKGQILPHLDVAHSLLSKSSKHF